MVFIALFSTVAVPVSTACFAMGSLPLLILRHDTPLDSGPIRGLFNTCSLVLMVTASFSTAGCAAVGRLTLSAGMGAIALLAFCSHKRVLARMGLLKGPIVAGDSAAASEFRQFHSVGMLFNAVQLLAVAWGLAQMSRPAQSPELLCAGPAMRAMLRAVTRNRNERTSCTGCLGSAARPSSRWMGVCWTSSPPAWRRRSWKLQVG